MNIEIFKKCVEDLSAQWREVFKYCKLIEYRISLHKYFLKREREKTSALNPQGLVGSPEGSPPTGSSSQPLDFLPSVLLPAQVGYVQCVMFGWGSFFLPALEAWIRVQGPGVFEGCLFLPLPPGPITLLPRAHHKN